MNINDKTGCLDKVKNINRRIINADGTGYNEKTGVVCEHFMDIFVNERKVFKLVCTPQGLKELVIGRLVTEGIIEDISDVESLYICESGNTARVFLNKEINFSWEISDEPTCCTGNKVLLKNAYGGGLARLSARAVDYGNVFAMTREFAADSKIHKNTNGTHCCYLMADGKITASYEDIGRHNALDKIVGYIYLNGYRPCDCMVFTTGRVPTDMAGKVIKAGIPVLISKAVPTDAAVKMAAEYNLNLICRAWPDRIEVFNEAE